MKLVLSPEQFLAVYSCITSSTSLTAQEVKSKMDSMLLEILSSVDESKNQSMYSHWTKQEAEKISDLNQELKSISNFQSKDKS